MTTPKYQIQSQRRRGGTRRLYGELERTTCPLDTHVDAENGTDTEEADGSTEHPFASVEAALPPDLIEHRRTLLLESGKHVSALERTSIARRVQGGELRIVGVGDAEVMSDAYEMCLIEILKNGRIRIRVVAEEGEK